MNTTLPSWKDRTQNQFGKLQIQVPWRSIQLLVPHRMRRKIRSKLRSRISPASSISSLQTSFSPMDTLRQLQCHRWTLYDFQYLLLLIVGIFSLSVMESPGPLAKTAAFTLLLISLLLPITRQFFLPFLPIAGWLIFFYACQFVPSDWRPAIWVRVLPALENILYGANISNILSAHQNVVLDVLAWLPYGICHYGAPFVCSAIMFIFGPPGTTPLFARTFGYISMFAVTVQLVFPCSPPWYENLYGLAPADYSMPGNPAGLARIDKLFGIDLYTSGFKQSPVVFGAFPSLHAADSTLAALFMSQVFPRLKPLFVTYTLWMWWATMYLSHHYAVDLVGGGLLATVAFYFAKTRFMPRVQKDKMFRWEYDYVEYGDSAPDYGYGLASFEGDFNLDSDEWTVGSSSSISSGSLSPVDDHYSWEGETLASPATDIESGRHF
ncbi:phosphatase PAP2 family protein [Aspergillus clavatus NRRL 1]|uniref:Aureobasidin resistance protein Aur1 n=1 Tax=Aspergillus clavatus (strain ATCC 1007 / CBS 513.65 / DSM 816 / NCTC 3887 / NRRL 1 / QM 1276 / 107) TaxID=344612 RepID=A1CK96_ASPCL|nr:aureobasidin resistance protein Aur1 [Aspergillus clavatus NRRL 1]EAW09570.1 aureobasidin resistance protein Aur1 [Aspergillus clavatus NRRL 1]